MLQIYQRLFQMLEVSLRASSDNNCVIANLLQMQTLLLKLLEVF